MALDTGSKSAAIEAMGTIMIRNWIIIATALGAAVLATAADASSARYHHRYGASNSGYHPGYYIGYWGGSGHWANSQRLSRPGPRYGYKFDWASYRGDPFAGQTISMATIAITLTSTTIAWVVAGVAASGGSGPYRSGFI